MDGLDLLKIAQVERDGKTGDLFGHLDSLLSRVDFPIPEHPSGVAWMLGNHGGGVNPVVHALTDKFSLIGVLGALEILGIPGYGVPCMAQYRHDMKLEPFAWLTAIGGLPIKWSTAGDMMVDDGKGGKVVVQGKSGNAALRTTTQTYCNFRSLEFASGKMLTFIRTMPMLPYSQDKAAFNVNEDGVIHSEMNTDGVRLAYSVRAALQHLHQRTKAGHETLLRAAIKPTQALEDGVMAGLLKFIIGKTKVNTRRAYGIDYYAEHKERVDTIIALLPKEFFHGMENWEGELEEIIADYAYPMLVVDMVTQKDVTYLTTDLDGDRGTDLLAGTPETLMTFMKMIVSHLGNANQLNPNAEGPLLHTDDGILDLWHAMGYKATHGMSIQSIMHTISGAEIYEMLLGTADTMLNRLLDGNEDSGSYYDPRIHFELTIAAVLRVNPRNTELEKFCIEAMERFDEVYGPGKIRPRFIEGMNKLREIITPWNV